MYIYCVLKKFKNHINKELSFLKGSRLLIAISGGLDSVVLSYLCHEIKLDFALVHCNFNLRDEESDGDEAFVLQLGDNFNKEVFIESFDTKNYATDHKLSIQMAARELRYDFFDELREQLDFDYILTAHHADDNLETFLINLSRGTGLEGLTGIPEQNNTIIRPLIPFDRASLEAYALKNKIIWREDSSNDETKYLRNKLRHDVIPKLKEINPLLLQNFARTQAYLRDSKEIVDDRIDAISNDVITTLSEDHIYFNIEKLLELNNPKAYLYELLKDYGFTEWNDAYNLLEAQSGKQIFSATHRLLKDRESLILTEVTSEINFKIDISENESQVKTPLGELCFDTVDAVYGKHTNTIFVDKDLLKFPLEVRTWKKGDYFYPFGMQGSKKLSKFFKDEKWSLVDKENCLLLCSGDEIVWIINYRADNRFRVTRRTKHILKIKLRE